MEIGKFKLAEYAMLSGIGIEFVRNGNEDMIILCYVGRRIYVPHIVVGYPNPSIPQKRNTGIWRILAVFLFDDPVDLIFYGMGLFSNQGF